MTDGTFEKKDKRFWTHVLAGSTGIVTTLIAVLFCVNECSNKEKAESRGDNMYAKLVQADSLLNVFQGRVKDLAAENGDLRDDNADLLNENGALRDTIVVRDSTIAQLRDSLTDCRNDKTKRCLTCQKKKAPAKSVAKPVEPVVPACEQKSEIYVAPDTVIVRNPQKPAQTVIINGDNNGTVNTGTIIVNGNNNNVNSNISEKQNGGNIDSVKIVRIKRVRCR